MSSSSLSSPSSAFSHLVVKETATFTWTIDDYDQVDKARSTNFSPPNSVHQFRLELDPENCAFGLDRVFLELSYNKQEKSVPLCYRISLLDSDGKKHYTKEYYWHYRENDFGLCHYNVISYIPRDKCHGLIVNGSLSIYCEVDVLGENPTSSPSPSTIESFGKLSANYETLLESGKFSDFTVTVGGKQFRVHQNILASRSEAFAVMFEEAKEVNEVMIEDMEVEVFELMVRYIYTGKMDGVGEHADGLFVAADMYQLDHLKSICEQSLISSDSFSVFSAESVCAVLLISDVDNAHELKSKCIEYIVDNWKEVKETKCWLEEIKGKRADLIEDILDFRY